MEQKGGPEEKSSKRHVLAEEPESHSSIGSSPGHCETMLYKNKYRSESARCPYWDYSTPGFYLVTICTHDRQHHFGTVSNGTMVLSEMGACAERYWKEIPNQFSFANADAFVIMPNHIHGVIQLMGDSRLSPRRDTINRVPTGDQGNPAESPDH